MELNEEQINDIITATIIRTLKIIKEQQDNGEDLNSVDYEYIIQCRERDMSDPSVLDTLVMPDDYKEQVWEQMHWM